MAALGFPLRVLLIRAWIHKLEPIRTTLRAAGMDPRFTRVDIEPALNAALTRGGFDIAIFDPRTPGLTRELVEARLKEHRRYLPIIVLGDLSTLAEHVGAAISARHN